MLVFHGKKTIGPEVLDSFFSHPLIPLCFFSDPLTDLLYSVSISLSLPLRIGDDVFVD